jgi:hypothetical protein
MSCYEFEGTRYVRGRHFAECGGEDCSGCLRCPENHCGECKRGTHLGFGEATCPECIGRVRATLRAILDLYAALPEEAIHRGVNSEAANLAGPVADAEAYSWRKAHLAKTIAWELLPEDDEHHPGNVLGGWVAVIGEDYGDRPDRQLTLSELVDYLDRRLGRIAHDVGQDFGQFRREVSRCKAHLEAVLHDGEQVDTGAPCMTCNVPLQRVWGVDSERDGWRCPKCKQTSTEDQYRFAVKHLHREEATELTDHDMEIRTGVRAGTVRVWAKRGIVGRRQDSGRTLYVVADVVKRAMGETA